MWSFCHPKSSQAYQQGKAHQRCLRVIGNRSNNNTLIYSIQEAVCKLQSQTCKVTLAWVPSHQGIKGNENADAEARLATTTPVHPEAKLAPTEVKYFIHHKITEHWNNVWNSTVTKLHLVQDNIKDRFYNGLNRSHRCVINRLRIGHTNLTDIHVVTKTNPIKCPRCDTRLSIHHLLTECEEYQAEKNQLDLLPSMETLLCDPRGQIKTRLFLKTIKLYKSV